MSRDAPVHRSCSRSRTLCAAVLEMRDEDVSNARGEKIGPVGGVGACAVGQELS
jgi:hypothetical protein